MTIDEYRGIILDLAVLQSKLLSQQGKGVVFLDDHRDLKLIACCLKNVLGMTLETAQAWSAARID